jgi:hypothetical protein
MKVPTTFILRSISTLSIRILTYTPDDGPEDDALSYPWEFSLVRRNRRVLKGTLINFRPFWTGGTWSDNVSPNPRSPIN